MWACTLLEHVPLQGLMKEEGKERFGSQFTMWQKQASEFEIDEQAPVRCIPLVLK